MDTCKVCGAELPARSSLRGRPPEFCSSSCRDERGQILRSLRNRERALANAVAQQAARLAEVRDRLRRLGGRPGGGGSEGSRLPAP